MFKISLLSAASGKQDGQQQESRRPSKLQPSSQLQQQKPQQNPSKSTLEPRGWALQASDITEGLLDASTYKSLAVYAEVKLAEALDRASKALPDAVDDSGAPLPNSLKTAVCCQLLGELAELCGPFSGTLMKLRDQLLPAVYSSYAAAQASQPLQFDQMPWFSVALRLQHDNKALLAQQEAFKLELSRHQSQMAAVEQQLLTFKAAMDAGEAAAAGLTGVNASLMAARDAAVEEASVAAEESKRLSAEVTRLKDELSDTQEQLNNAKDLASQDLEQWQGQLAVLQKQLHVEQQERESAVALAAARLTTAEGLELEQRCLEAERRLEEVEHQLATVAGAAATGLQQQQQQQQALTPRPTDWGPAEELAEKCKDTSETVRQLLQQHAATVTALQQQLQILQALSVPDPAPKPWELNLRTATSTYFITEGALNLDCLILNPEPSAAKPKLFAEPLGLGPGVPRFLRWDEAVELQEVGLLQLQQQVRSIWGGKARHEALHGSCHLQSYLYHHFNAEATAAGNSAADAAAVAAAGASGSNSSSNSSSSRSRLQFSRNDSPEAQASEARAAAAAAGYSFYHACCMHRHDSVAVDVMWQVLTGQLAESVVLEQRQQAQGLITFLQELAAAAAAAAGGGVDTGRRDSSSASGQASAAGALTASHVSTAVRFLYPYKSHDQLAEITACTTDAVLKSSSSGSTTSSVVSSSDDSNSVSCERLRAVAVALQQAAANTIGFGVQQQQQQQQQKQQHDGGEGCIQGSRAAAAGRNVLECILRQHLQAVLNHMQEAADQVKQLMVGNESKNATADAVGGDSSQQAAGLGGCSSSSSSSSSSCGMCANRTVRKAWSRLAAFLYQAEGAGSCIGSSSSSSSVRPGNIGLSKQLSGSQQQVQGQQQGGVLGTSMLLSGRQSSRGSRYSDTGHTQDMPLVAAAAAAAAAACSTAHMQQKDVMHSTCHTSGSRVAQWLAAAECMHSEAVGLQQLQQWLQRECLLVPACCCMDVPAAVQWCRTAMRIS